MTRRQEQSSLNTLGPVEIADHLERIINEQDRERDGVLDKRVHVPIDKVEAAISFWKPYYFDVTIEGRHLNGIEAYDLGDPSKNEIPNAAPYIAMCNLMALEALLRIGGANPTTFDAAMLAFGSEREVEIASMWKEAFAPTAFQAEWAWKAVLAVLGGEPHSTREVLDDFRQQLP